LDDLLGSPIKFAADLVLEQATAGPAGAELAGEEPPIAGAPRAQTKMKFREVEVINVDAFDGVVLRLAG
jgi:hypothetical protein